MLLDFRLPSLEYVQELKGACPVFLFSNTNIIHYQYFQESIRTETRYAHLDELFHKAYYSHDIGFRKPDADGYLHIIREQGLDPARTLFVDDNAQNIAGAKAVGLQTHHFLPSERVETLLPSLLKGNG
jgi:glucose-1-phosphatase